MRRRAVLLVFVVVAALALRGVLRLRGRGLGVTADAAGGRMAVGLALAAAVVLAAKAAGVDPLVTVAVLLVLLWATGVAGFALGELGITLPAPPSSPGDSAEGTEDALQLELEY